MKKARYICFEGTEGVGKTTQTQKLVDYLRSKGYSVLHTKEPGTTHAPLTLVLRGIMLDNQYDKELTAPAREFISQAIRSIHLEKVIYPAMEEYDFIIQDRGVLSGLAYGKACGNPGDFLRQMASYVTPEKHRYSGDGFLYDDVIYLKGNIIEGLEKAKSSKQEFETGDAMESRGNEFMMNVSKNMTEYSSYFNTHSINVENKNIDRVFTEILTKLKIEG